MNQGRLATTLLLTWLMIFSCSVLADDVADEEELLADLFPPNCDFSGQFVQRKQVEGVPMPLKSVGDFFYSCELGLVWHTQMPFEETILYVNAVNNYRVDENGEITPLTGIARYIMSNVFVKLLKGDAEYFAEEFAVSKDEANQGIILVPQSEFMQKGIADIAIQTREHSESKTVLTMDVTDVTGQITSVSINDIRVFDIDGKREAFEKCEELYASQVNWCQILRSPSRLKRL